MRSVQTEQKRITGRNADLYHWVDRTQPNKRPQYRPPFEETSKTRTADSRLLSKAFMYLAFIVLVFTVSLAIGMLAQNASIKQDTTKIQEECEILEAKINNLAVDLASNSRSDKIIPLSEELLGMEKANVNKIYVLTAVPKDTDDSALTAEAIIGGR
ncbi:MAG: hypothetical protein IJC48_11665 [Clostridia bacterium]|nr:hypothetical protein [Clostridia bacterium]